MTYIPKDRFLQICCGSRQYNTQHRDTTDLFALDEGGGVWSYDFDHRVWVELNRDRAEKTGKDWAVSKGGAR